MVNIYSFILTISIVISYFFNCSLLIQASEKLIPIERKNSSEGKKEVRIPAHLQKLADCLPDKPKKASIITKLEEIWRKKVNTMSVEEAVCFALPKDLQLRILYELNSENSFITSLIEQIKQPHNSIHTSFGAMTGLQSAAFYNKSILIGGYYVDNIIEIRKRISGKLTQNLYGHASLVRVLLIHDGILFAADDSGAIKIWHLPINTCIRTIKAHNSFIKELALKDNKLASASFDHTVKVWDWQTGKCVHEFTQPKDILYTVVFMKDTVVAGGADGIYIWDVASGQCVHQFPHHSWSIAVIDNSTFVSTGSNNLSIFSIDPLYFETIIKGCNDARVVAYVPHNLVITGSCNGTLSFFELPTFTLLCTMQAHEKTILSLKYQDGKIITISSDDHIKTWDISTIKQLTHFKNFLHKQTSLQQGYILYLIAKFMDHKKATIATVEEEMSIQELRKTIHELFGPLAADLFHQLAKRYLI